MFRDVFVALEEVRGVQALCPTWLPEGVRPTSIYAGAVGEYVVEFEPRDEFFPHVVLQLALGEPAGRRLRHATVGAKNAIVYFESSRRSPGIHSGHYIAAFPGGAYQRGVYWVSLHQDSAWSERRNVERLLRIARSLRPVE